MRTTLVAYTKVTEDLFRTWDLASEMESDSDLLTEFAGRACYQSWTKPNPDTDTNRKYLANILLHQHFSVLEHASMTLYIEGVSRSLTHELVRHRHLSFSQLSQRFVDESDAEYVLPPALADDETVRYLVHNTFKEATNKYEFIVNTLQRRGFSRKQAREAARCVLPNATETKIVVTGNLRAWREFVQKRNTDHADAEIRDLARRVLNHLRAVAPHCVQDVTDE